MLLKEIRPIEVKKELFEVLVDVWDKVGDVGERWYCTEKFTTYAFDYEDAEERAIDYLRVKYPEKFNKLVIVNSLNKGAF